MNQLNPTCVIRRDDLTFILAALMSARPDLREGFYLVSQATGVSEMLSLTQSVLLASYERREKGICAKCEKTHATKVLPG